MYNIPSGVDVTIPTLDHSFGLSLLIVNRTSSPFPIFTLLSFTSPERITLFEKVEQKYLIPRLLAA